jgi:hypothetical protein
VFDPTQKFLFLVYMNATKHPIVRLGWGSDFKIVGLMTSMDELASRSIMVEPGAKFKLGLMTLKF